MKITKKQLEKAFESACRYINDIEEDDSNEEFWPIGAKACKQCYKEEYYCKECIKEYFLKKAKEID